MKSNYRTALIVGAGDGLSASVARTFARDGGMRIALAARNPGKLTALAKELDGCMLTCDAAEPGQVTAMFARADEYFGAPPDVVVYNPSFRVRGSIVDIDPAAVAKALAITAYGGFPRRASRRRSAWCRAATARFYSPARQRASKAIRCQHLSRWANSPCAASRKASRANCSPRASTSRIS
jgi:NAD(P)-dependent dehydrogenase (short-subunit alcohol dehydrogenase family)